MMETSGIAPQSLYVDLDGTLVRTDTLWESLVLLSGRAPFKALSTLTAIASGRSAFKRRVADGISIDPASLPYDETLLVYLRAEHERGRRIVLATAAHETIARSVADHLGMFDDVLATDARGNNKGEAKAERIREHAAGRSWAYAGDHAVDLSIWKQADAAVVVTHDRNLVEQAARHTTIERTFMKQSWTLADLLRQWRVHQWVKNILLFVPLFLAHRITDPDALLNVVLAVVVFNVVASAVYVVNDLMDLASDRQHPTKRHRPLASGILPIPVALASVPVLLAVGTVITAILLPWSFALWVAGYAVITTLYTFVLKRIAIVDVLTLSGLYTLRILAGGAAAGVSVSPWLLMFSMFLFTSLAFLKRYTELVDTADREGTTVAGRGYVPADADFVRSIGPGVGLIAVLVFTLYLNSRDVQILYVHPLRLWLLVPCLLYWISRLWFIAHRREMHDDPILFAVRDPISYLVGIVALVIIVMASI